MNIATCDVTGFKDGRAFSVKKGQKVPDSLADYLKSAGVVKNQPRKKGHSND